MILEDGKDGCQPQPRSLTHILRRKKRLKDALLDLFVHPDSVVGYLDAEISPTLDLRIGDQLLFTTMDDIYLDLDMR